MLTNMKGLLTNTKRFLTGCVEPGSSSSKSDDVDMYKVEMEADLSAETDNSTSKADDTSTCTSPKADDISTHTPPKADDKATHISPKAADTCKASPKADRSEHHSFSLAHILSMIKEEK